jgi:hypothetical protein
MQSSKYTLTIQSIRPMGKNLVNIQVVGDNVVFSETDVTLRAALEHIVNRIVFHEEGS